MITLTTDKVTELVFTKDPDVKVKKVEPFRWVPIDEVEINGGVPLSFKVRALNSFEQLEIMSQLSSPEAQEEKPKKNRKAKQNQNQEGEKVDFISPMLAALKVAVVEAKGEGFHEKDPDGVLSVLKRTPPALLTLLGTWVTEHSWGADPFSEGK